VSRTDFEQLAEPEFAGLWEKRPAFKPAGDSAVKTGEMPRAKTCKTSKMEQVCFFTVLYLLLIGMFVNIIALMLTRISTCRSA